MPQLLGIAGMGFGTLVPPYVTHHGSRNTPLSVEKRCIKNLGTWDSRGGVMWCLADFTNSSNEHIKHSKVFKDVFAEFARAVPPYGPFNIRNEFRPSPSVYPLVWGRCSSALWLPAPCTVPPAGVGTQEGATPLLSSGMLRVRRASPRTVVVRNGDGWRVCSGELRPLVGPRWPRRCCHKPRDRNFVTDALLVVR